MSEREEVIGQIKYLTHIADQESVAFDHPTEEDYHALLALKEAAGGAEG